MSEQRWEFWIDVGGTFTDCVARNPDGVLLRHKLLSSGVTKGRIQQDSTDTLIRDAARTSDPNGVWNGYRCQLLDDRGSVVDESVVRMHDSARGVLQLKSPFQSRPLLNQSYE